MSWTAPVVPVSGTVITVSWASANVVQPLNWLRLLTGNADPPGTNYVVLSLSSSGSAWGKIPSDAILDGAIVTSKILDQNVTTAKIADQNVTTAKLQAGAAVANIGYTPINKGGDAGIGSLTLTAGQRLSFGAGGNIFEGPPGTFFAVAHDVFVVTKADGSAQILNVSPAQFNWMGHPVVFLDRGQDFSGAAPPTIGGSYIITHANIGAEQAGSATLAIDSSNLGAIPAASYARLNALANFTAGLQAAGSAVVTTATIGSLTAGSATLAIDSSNLGAIPAASYARLNALANFTAGLQSGGFAVIHAGNIGSQTVGNATNAVTAANATQLGGVAASGYSEMATGTYTGNGTGGRTISTPFSPSSVHFQLSSSGGAVNNGYAYLGPNAKATIMPVGAATVDGNAGAFGANSFSVPGSLNATGITYSWAAFG